MVRQKVGKSLAIQGLLAVCACLVVSTGLLMTARSQTLESQRDGDSPDVTLPRSKSATTITTEALQARRIMAEAVAAADEGDYERAIQFARQALQYTADWQPDELHPSQFIEYMNAELQRLQEPEDDGTNEAAATQLSNLPTVTEETEDASGSQPLPDALAGGVHFNINPGTNGPAQPSHGDEAVNSVYVVLAVLSLIFVVGFAFVFHAMFVLLRDRQQQQDNLLRLDLTSLGDLTRLAPYAQLAGGSGAQASEFADHAAGKDDTQPGGTSQFRIHPQPEPAGEDAMFQHLLEDNIELYRNLNQRPKAA